MNMSLIQNITTTKQMMSSGEICYLNQYAMINELSKLPPKIFWFLVAGVLVYMINLYILPFLKERLKDNYSMITNSFHAFSVSVLFLGLWLMSLFVFEITAEKVRVLNYIIPPLIAIILIILGIKRGWFKKLKNIKYEVE